MKKAFKKNNLRKTIGIGILAIGFILLVLGSVLQNVDILSALGVLFCTGGVITTLCGEKEHGLFKMAGGFVLLTVLFSWLIPISSFSGTEMTVSEITRIGLSDFAIYGLLSLYYFAIVVSFLLILGGMYGILSKTSGYQKLIEKLTDFLKGNEIIFVLVTSFLFAVVTAFSNEVYQILILVPLVITLVLTLKMDKITALCTTFGSIMIGLIGSMFSPMISEYFNSYLDITYANEAATKLILFVATYVLFNFFNVLHIRKTLKDKVNETKEDPFEVEKVETKGCKRAWPLVVVLVILVLFQIIGYISWNDVFQVTAFDNYHTWLTSLSVKEVPVISYFLGNASSFGNWDLYIIQLLMLLTTGIIALIYKVDLNDLLKQFGNGAKKMLKPIIVLLLIYMVCIFSVMYPIIPTIVNSIMSLAKNFNVFLTALSAAIASIFNVEARYVSSNLIPYFAAVYGSEANNPVIALIFQSIYGFIQFFAPTSLMLMLGLSYLDIPYKTWLKYIWQFLVGLFIVVIALICFVAFL